MKKRLWLFALVLGAPVAGATEPSRGTYAEDARVAHIEGVLAALAETPAAEIENQAEYARTIARGACAAGAPRLRIECLLVAMDRHCRERDGDEARRCKLTMDVVVSNALADERLIPPADRYRIMQDNADYRAALARELRRIQGGLAVDFRLHAGDVEGARTMAASIDRYCRTSADETRFPYPTCVSSLVWFVRETK